MKMRVVHKIPLSGKENINLPPQNGNYLQNHIKKVKKQ
jgi:hypothetical protein